MVVPVEELAKLVPLLGSSSDGEVLAVVRAIGRKLKREGHDWHDLARVLQGRAPPQPSPHQADKRMSDADRAQMEADIEFLRAMFRRAHPFFK